MLWKNIRKQTSCWKLDQNGGVCLIISYFLAEPDVSKKDVGFHRDNPNIYCEKNTRKDLETALCYQTFHDNHFKEGAKIIKEEKKKCQN
jgi:hypothetical protein